MSILEPTNSVERVEAAFTRAVDALEGIEIALDYEPEKLPPRPCVTMLFVEVEQADVSTGPSTDDTWSWRVNVYVDLGTRTRDYRGAQRELKRLIPRVLGVVRADQRLEDTTIRAEIRDEGEEPTFDHGGGLIWKSLRLSALVEEI